MEIVNTWLTTILSFPLLKLELCFNHLKFMLKYNAKTYEKLESNIKYILKK